MMASVGVFSFPSALAGGAGATGGGAPSSSSQVPSPISPVVKPAASVSSNSSSGSSPETSPSPPPSMVSPMTPPPQPVQSASPTPEMSPPLVVRPPTPPMAGPAGLFAEAFKLVDGSPFDELDSNASVGRGGPGSVGAPESVNGGGSSAGYPLEVGGSLSDCMEQDCSLCQNKFISPRVLACLHVFCETCLEKHLGDADEVKKLEGLIECPTCKQPTKVGTKGIGALHQDYILTNVLDLSTIEPSMLACTSCKS